MGVAQGRQMVQKGIHCQTWHIQVLADTIPCPPQSVLGALIAVNLKNSLKQLADPFYLWKKSKLDCVSAWGGRRHRLARAA